MNKIFFTLFFITLFQVSYNSCTSTGNNTGFVSIQNWVSTAQVPTVLKNLSARLLIAGVVTWATGEILVDMWYRYLQTKEVVLECEQELRENASDVLTEREIKFWSFIQGLSRVPSLWWRELCATALTIAFVDGTRKLLLTN
jgi:hypothetical protein